MRHDPLERSEIQERLSEREVHEGARCFEVEFYDAGGVGGGVCGDEGVVGGAEAGYGGVHEDGGRGGEGVEVREEGGEGGGS